MLIVFIKRDDQTDPWIQSVVQYMRFLETKGKSRYSDGVNRYSDGVKRYSDGVKKHRL